MLSKLKSNMPPLRSFLFLLSANLRALRARAYDRHFWCRNYIKANKLNILLLQFYSGVARGIAKGGRGERRGRGALPVFDLWAKLFSGRAEKSLRSLHGFFLFLHRLLLLREFGGFQRFFVSSLAKSSGQINHGYAASYEWYAGAI